MVNVELLENKSILIFKLHRVIIPNLGINVKLFRNFISFFSPLGLSSIERKGSHIGGIGVRFGGPGHKDLGAGGERFVFCGW